MSGIMQMLLGSAVVPTDPYFSDVTLLLPGNGTNGAQNNTFLDSSANNFTVTRNGNTTQGTFSPFPLTTGSAWNAATNGGSGYFDGGGDYLTVPDNASLNFGSSDFTVEMWVYPTAVGQASLTLLYAKPNGSGYSGLAIGQAVGGYGVLVYVSSTGTSWDLASGVSAGTMTANAWNHIAVSRSGSNLRAFLNGVLESTTNISTATLVTTTAAVSIGSSLGTASTYLTGFASNVRVVKGTAVYTAAFTPPTAPLTAITNTSLLLNFTNAGIYDATAKNDLETLGNAQISTGAAKWGTTSMYFDGTGDYLTSPANNLYRLMAGDFTVEMWVRLAASQANMGLVSSYTTNTGWIVRLDTTTVVFAYGTGGSATVVSNAASLTTGTWYHVAWTKSGTTLRSFVDGTQVGSNHTVSSAADTGAIGLQVGRTQTSTNDLTGYIQDLRITKGVARYTANFTPPTAAFPVQ